MTITTPNTIQVSSESELWIPEMAQHPLQRALENVNYLMKWHRPPLASVCYTNTAELTRSAVYVVPIFPSADALDGMRYSAQHRFICSSASQAVTISIDSTTSYTGVTTTWVNLTSDAATSDGVGGALSTHTQADFTIATAAEALRITYTAPAAGNRTDHHLLVYPSPAAPTVGIAASGATPFDDGLIADGDDAPVHTEWINRCKATSVAVLTDRKQNCLSFVQEETSYRYLWDGLAADKYYPLPPVRIWFPNQGPSTTLDVLALATVDGGVTTDLVRVRQTGKPASLTSFYDAGGGIQAGTLKLELQGTGLMVWADVEVAVKRETGQETRFIALMAYYTPGTD